MTDYEQEPWQEPWPEKMYLLHPSIKTFGAMVSNPERREYVRADRIEELVKGMDALQDRLDTANKARADAMSLAVKKQDKLAKAVEWFKKLDRRGDALETFDTVVHEIVTAALAELEVKEEATVTAWRGRDD